MSDVILVIEDSGDIRENTTELLELAGYKAVSAVNGKDGLEQARKIRPDLILCDIMMPELDGYGVLRALENIPELSGTPFIFFTAKTEKSDFRIAMDLGADDYLPKPFSGDELLRVVSARLKKNRMLKAKANHLENLDNIIIEAQSLDEIGSLSANRTVKKLRNKDMIYMEGDSATHLCFVMSGRVKVYKTNEWGKDYITEIIKTGEFFGHVALLNDHPHKQSAMAIENSEIALIPRQDFFQPPSFQQGNFAQVHPLPVQQRRRVGRKAPAAGLQLRAQARRRSAAVRLPPVPEGRRKTRFRIPGQPREPFRHRRHLTRIGQPQPHRLPRRASHHDG